MGEINVFLLVILFMSIFDLLKYNFFFFSFLTLPATFMHEFMHFLFSFILNGKPVSVNLIPYKTEKHYVLGSVESSNVRWYNGGIISLAPLVLLFLVFYFYNYVCIDLNTSILSFLKIYFLSCLLYGSIPSSQDIKVFLKTSYVLILILILIFCSYNIFT